jgi:hypothetical protein
MSETDLDARLDAVERALTDDETDLTDVREAAALAATVEDLEARVDDLEETVAELDAGLQAVRGYAGNVRAVNREVERRASAALAKVETLESSLDERAHTDRPSTDQRTSRRALDTDDPDEPGRDRVDRESHTGRRDTRRDAGTDRAFAIEGERSPVEPGSGRTDRSDRTDQGDRTDRDRPADLGDQADRAGRVDRPDRADRAGRGDPGDRDGDDESDDGTEQFIQRVREAL